MKRPASVGLLCRVKKGCSPARQEALSLSSMTLLPALCQASHHPGPFSLLPPRSWHQSSLQGQGSLQRHAHSAKTLRRPCRLPSMPSCSTAGPAGPAASAAPAAPPASRPRGAGLLALSPMQACLLRHGLADQSKHGLRDLLQGTPSPHLEEYLLLSEEAVASLVEPKLVALQAEGLTLVQMLRVLSARGGAALRCDCAKRFLPNLETLRAVVASAAMAAEGTAQQQQQQHARGEVQHPQQPPHLQPQQPAAQQPGRSAMGALLVHAPAQASRYLARDPMRVAELLSWLEDSLGIGPAQLGACPSLLAALCTTLGNARSVAWLLHVQAGLGSQDIRRVFLAEPRIFRMHPMTIATRLGCLKRSVQASAPAALSLAHYLPYHRMDQLEDSLPQLLSLLDGWLGEAGAGGELVLECPELGAVTPEAAEACVVALLAQGMRMEDVAALLRRHPVLLTLRLELPGQQRKLEWAKEDTPWGVANCLVAPGCGALAPWCQVGTLAARLDFLRAKGLKPSRTPACLAPGRVDAVFAARVARRLRREVGEVQEEWGPWREEWLRSEVGRRWGGEQQ